MLYANGTAPRAPSRIHAFDLRLIENLDKYAPALGVRRDVRLLATKPEALFGALSPE